MNQSQIMNQPQVLMNRPPQILQILDQVHAFPLMKKDFKNRPEMNRNYGVWPPPQQKNSLSLGFACPRPRTKTIRSNHELQNQNRFFFKGRRFYHNKKRRFSGFAPHAPRNTSSFLIRAKKSGGVADLVSPCPVTPAVLPTPNLSPLSEIVGDTAKEEWGVDGYGSMKGLIRLRSPGGGYDSTTTTTVTNEDDDEEMDNDEASSESDDNKEEEEDYIDVSRFEMMIRPSNECLEDRVDFHERHIFLKWKKRICGLRIGFV